MRQVVFLVESISAGFVFWLGLYIITRDLPLSRVSNLGWRRPALFSGIANLLLAIFLMGVAMQTVAATPQEFILWQKSTWWTVPIAAVAFLESILLLLFPSFSRRHKHLHHALMTVLSSYALLLSGGIVIGFFLRNADIQRINTNFAIFHSPIRTPQYYAYSIFISVILIICLVALLFKCWQSWGDDDEFERHKWLGFGAVFAFAGTLVGTVLHPLSMGLIPEQLGDFIIMIGVALVGYGVVNHNALLHEQVLKHDFWHSFLSVSLTAFLYLSSAYGLFWFLGYLYPPLLTPLLLLLAMVTQTPVGWEEAVSDRLLLPRWTSAYRDRLRQLRQEIVRARQPDSALDQAEVAIALEIQDARLHELHDMIKREVDYIFQYTRFEDDAVMADSPLHQLRCLALDENGSSSQELTGYQRASHLKTFLSQEIESALASVDEERLTDEEIGYLILDKKYIEQLTRPAVETYFEEEHGLVVRGGAYSRHLASARKRLAQRIHSQEVELLVLYSPGHDLVDFG